MNRLFREIGKKKEILSSNKDVFIKMAELDGEINLEMTIKREQFEEAIKEYAAKIEAAIKRIIEKSGLSVSGIHSFEIIGGGLRVPMIKDTISQAIGDTSIPLSTHVNGDESMSFGASYVAANNSAQFVVRDVFLHQTVPEDIVLKITGPVDAIEKTVFHEGEGLGKTEKFNVSSHEDLKLEFFAGEKKILEAEITGIADIKERPEAKVNATTPEIIF